MNKKHNNHLLGTIEKQAAWALRQFKKSQIVKEVKYYADGIVETISQSDILPDKKRLVKEAKKNLEGFMKKIQKSNVAHMAIDLASQKSSQLLSLFDFPTKKEVSRLNARLSQLEKKLKGLNHKRAHAR